MPRRSDVSGFSPPALWPNLEVMTNTARLDNVAHAQLRITSGYGAAFGDAINQIALFLPEFEEAQRDYPILFLRQEDGTLQAVAILGLERDENLFLEGSQWRAAYVPAMARRGPFLIGFAQGEPVIHVDLDHPRVVREGGEGHALFLAHGGQAPALEHALDALRTIHVGNEVSKAMTALFDELGLVEAVKLDVQVSDRHSYSFNDYLAVTHEKIAALDGAALARLNAAGLLLPAIFAASSLANVNRLISRKRARGG
jgi:hypothetical protein